MTVTSQPRQGHGPMLAQCWHICYDGGPTIKHNLANAIFWLIRCEWIFDVIQVTQLSQQTRDIHPMPVQWRPIVCDAGPTLNQLWVNVSCSLGIVYILHSSRHMVLHIAECRLGISHCTIMGISHCTRMHIAHCDLTTLYIVDCL